MDIHFFQLLPDSPKPTTFSQHQPLDLTGFTQAFWAAGVPEHAAEACQAQHS